MVAGFRLHGGARQSLSPSRLLSFTACLNEPTSHTKQQALPAQDSGSGGMRQGFWWDADLTNSCPAPQSHTDAISARHNIHSGSYTQHRISHLPVMSHGFSLHSYAVTVLLETKQDDPRSLCTLK